MNITNGSVTFERVTRPADYESKRASVTLSFAVDEQDNARLAMRQVGNMARDEALRLVGEKAERPVEAIVVPSGGEPTIEVVQPVKTVTEARPIQPAQVDPAPSAPSPGAPSAMAAVSVQQPTDDEIRKAIEAKRVTGVPPEAIKAVTAKYVSTVGASYKTIAPGNPARTDLLRDINALGTTQTGEDY
jgi:hypothetical protein